MPRGVPKKRGGDFYTATETFANDKYGMIHRGDHVREGHELIAAYPQWFTKDVYVRFDVEQATAAPGEQRGDA